MLDSAYVYLNLPELLLGVITLPQLYVTDIIAYQSVYIYGLQDATTLNRQFKGFYHINIQNVG